MLRKVLREPLLHFVVLGALVFLSFRFVTSDGDARDDRIVVTPGKVEQLVIGFSRTWQRPPDQRELAGLVEDYIRDEVLYREAVAMGLDKDDTIVRRRMRQKFEFLTEDTSAAVTPTDRDLQLWLDRHQDKFATEPRIAFTQIYFRRGHPGEPASPETAKILASLNHAEPGTAAADQGDATLLPRELPLTRFNEIAAVFGDDFARQIEPLATGVWSGPITSGYGLHLVRVDARTEGKPRPLREVRDAVTNEWMAEQHKQIIDLTYARLREKYAIVIEDPKPEQATNTSERR